MIVMALDHTRDFFSRLRFPPEDLSRAGPALFFTRWITHFCAPAFFLLAGVGASLAVSGGRSRKEVSRFLLTRGLFLMVLEVTEIGRASCRERVEVTGGGGGVKEKRRSRETVEMGELGHGDP